MPDNTLNHLLIAPDLKQLITCTSCGGLGYAHRQKIVLEKGKYFSELKTEMECLLCKGVGFTLR